MERINQAITKFLENQKLKEQAAKEAARVKRVSRHPHKDGCTLSGDITYEVKQLAPSNPSATFLVMYYMEKYTSECTECGEQDHSHE